MSIVVVGLNHRTAPVELREQFSLAHCALQMALEDLRQHNSHGHNNGGKNILNDSIILSTCHRFEIYANVEDAGAGRRKLEGFLGQLQGIPYDQFKSYLYSFEDRAAIEHLMRVASGLDSVVLGEPQILGQVTQAFLETQKVYKVGPITSQVFSLAIQAGKRARSETDIGRYTTSVGHAGARLIQQRVENLSKARLLLIGAGEIAELALRTLIKNNAKEIRIINRTFSRADALAKEVNATAINWYHLSEALVWADVVISATDAPHLVIHASEVMEILPKRKNRPLLFVDIAFPRDVDPSVKDLNNIQLADIDDLQLVVDENIAQRRAAIPKVEKIIEEEIETFYEWLNSRQFIPVVKELRQKIKCQIEEEIQNTLNKLKSLNPEEQQVIKRMAHRLSNRILHEPTIRLKAQNGNGFLYADAIRELFKLNGEKQAYTKLEKKN